MKTFADFRIDLPPNARGPEVDTTCPQCSPTRRKKYVKCLSVNIDLGLFLCHHCGWNGTLKDGEGERYAPQRRMYAKPRIHRLTPLPEKIIAWFHARGIPERILAQYHIGWGEMYFGELESQAWCIQFPYYRNGDLINVKYRTLDKHFRMATGAERILYGLDDIHEQKTLIWVEGEMDAMSLSTAGYDACVSVPDGAPDAKSRAYESKFAFLESAEDLLAQVETHILAVDNDENGQRLEHELSRRLGVEKCRRVTWPDGCKDANEVLIKHGSEVLATCITGAEPYPVEGLLRVNDVARDAWRIYEKGWEKGVSTGWANLDEYYTVKPGHVTVITGVPAHGKTQFVQALAVNLAMRHDWRFAIFSPEDAPNERLVTALAQRYTGKTIYNGHALRMQATEFAGAIEWLDEHFYLLSPSDEQNENLDTILFLAKTAVLRYGIKGFIIDPFNEVESNRPKDLTESEYIGQCLKRIRKFSRQHGVHTWVVAHPTKLYKEKDTKQYPIPTLYDISGSAHWRNKPDCGIVIYRPTTDDHDEVEVYIQKMKFLEVGKPGMVTLHYHRATGRLSA